jgi:hypothetical protein
VRLRIAGGVVRPHFVAAASPDDEVVDGDGFRLFVARAIVDQHADLVVDATEEHGNLIVRDA